MELINGSGKKIAAMIFSLFFAFIIVFSVFYCTVPPRSTSPAQKAGEVSLKTRGMTEKITLPHTVRGLDAGEEAELSFDTEKGFGDELLFASVYSPLRIYADDEMIYEYGSEGSYPSFLKDPPTVYDSVTLPYRDRDSIRIRMVYQMPRERSTINLHEAVTGSRDGIFHYMIARHGLPYILSLFFIFMGAVLVFMSFFFLSYDNIGKSFLFTGLLSLCAGAWQYGENPLSVFLTQQPAVMYILDFTGLFTLAIPLYHMTTLLPGMRKSRLLPVISRIISVSAFAAVLLCIFGVIPMHKSLFFFHFAIPAAIVLPGVYSVIEFIRERSVLSGLFCLAFIFLVVSALLELANYYLRFSVQFSFFFQIGLFAFMLVMAVFSGIHVRALFELKVKNAELENELKLRNGIIEVQSERKNMFLTHFEDMRRLRHDTRHHLRTLNDLLDKKDYESAKSYLASIDKELPPYEADMYCKNSIVNSTISYYARMAAREGIRTEIKVSVPAANANISDGNLCVIFGNLMENAVEACMRVKDAERYISLSSRIKGGMLFIMMENTTDGNVKKEDGYYLSSKRPGTGIGLHSVKSIAESHSGSISFEAKERIFRSAVCLRL